MFGKLGNYVIEPMDLHRHWRGIERLLEIEEWPFVLADFEVSEAQERAIAMVARTGDEVVAFFTVHHFGDIAYLDMVVVHPDRRKDVLMAGELWRQVRLRMKHNGFTSFVAHCTRSSASIVRILQYRAGISFSLLRKDAEPDHVARAIAPLDESALAELIALDAEVFGIRRENWIGTLMRQPSTRFFGRYEDGRLVASACLRERRDNSLCIDACNALRFEPLERLLDDVIAAHPHKRLECFVRHGADLKPYLEANGFKVPAFFAEIGPLVEYRLGPEQEVGLGPALRTLSWI